MTVVAKLTDALAKEVRDHGAGDASSAISRILAKYHVSMKPMHPEKTSGPLGRTFVLIPEDEPESEIDERGLADDLAHAPGVEGAYAKPRSEPA